MTYRHWMTGAAIAALVALAAGFILLGDQRPARADSLAQDIICLEYGINNNTIGGIVTLAPAFCPSGTSTSTQSAVLTVIKHVVGGSAIASDFTMNVSGTSVSSSTFPGSESGVSVALDSGSYSVTEASGGPADYAASYSSGCSGSITASSTVTCTVTNTYQPPVTVTIDKFIDGVAASTTAATASFPMTSTWTAANLNGGTQASATYSLSPAGFNSLNAYEAVTSQMSQGADYTTSEDTTGAVVGADCSSGDPYALVGYSSGTSLAAAEGATVNATAPSFTGMTQDEYVIVWNKSCSAPAATGVLEITKTVSGGTATPDQFSFAVNGAATTTFNANGVNDITEPEGSYTVTEASAANYTPSYTNSENADTDCDGIEVVANSTTTCAITNTYTGGNNGGGGGSTPTNVTQTIVVRPSDMQGWAFINDTLGGTGTGEMVLGPATPPLGSGSAELTATSTNDGEILTASIDQGIELADITKLTYSTYQSASNPSSAQAIALQFNVAQDATDPGAGWQGRIVYEPYNNNNGTVPLGSWQTWDALDGGNAKWWFSKPADFGGNCSQSSPCTLTSIIALYPKIGISANPLLGGVVLKAGSGWTSFEGDVDDLVIATTDGTNSTSTTYDFEPDLSDIGLTKSVDNSTPNLGDTVTYTLTASDTGADATGVVVQDLLPAGLTFVSTSSNDTVGLYDPVSGDWTIGDLSSTTPATLHIKATVNSGQSNGTVITNTASTTAGDTSGDTANNAASASFTITIPGNTPNNPGGGGGGGNGPPVPPGGGGGGGGIFPFPSGLVLGASTSSNPAECTQYLTAFIKLGGNNDASQVTRLQEFLNQFEGDNLTVNGIYDQATYQAVKAFQQKYASDILTPWGESTPTGYVYLTTRREVNIIYCNYALQFPLTSAQQAEIEAYKDEAVGGSQQNGGTHPHTQTVVNTPVNTPNNTGTSTQNQNSPVNPNLGQVGAAGVTQSGGGLWSNIASFFSHLFHR